MKQEDRELLLKDLSARLPYGAKCKDLVTNKDITLVGINCIYSNDNPMIISIEGTGDTYLYDIKLYLRPMSSMTDEECEELHKLVCPNNVGASFDIDAFYFLEADCHSHSISYTFMSKVIEFMLQHHLDYRGLIRQGLALEATEDMYK